MREDVICSLPSCVRMILVVAGQPQNTVHMRDKRTNHSTMKTSVKSSIIITTRQHKRHEAGPRQNGFKKPVQVQTLKSSNESI